MDTHLKYTQRHTCSLQFWLAASAILSFVFLQQLVQFHGFVSLELLLRQHKRRLRNQLINQVLRSPTSATYLV